MDIANDFVTVCEISNLPEIKKLIISPNNIKLALITKEVCIKNNLKYVPRNYGQPNMYSRECIAHIIKELTSHSDKYREYNPNPMPQPLTKEAFQYDTTSIPLQRTEAKRTEAINLVQCINDLDCLHIIIQVMKANLRKESN